MRAATLLSLACLLGLAPSLPAQKSPQVGYAFPPGGKAGTTVDVHLGGYDWTPDMEFVVHDPRVKLTPLGAPGPLLIPGPPYWFGSKSRLVALPLPRESVVRLTLPADLRAGPVYWHAANANGGTAAGVFYVGAGNEVSEDERRSSPQSLPVLPVTVNGRIQKVEEVDRYRFVAPRDGPITCELLARRLGAKFLCVLEVRDSEGRLVASSTGTHGADPALTFSARAKGLYEVSLHDVDFGGDRSYVYRLSIAPGPRVVGALPAAGKHGETREVEFVGFGVATGAVKLESVKRRVTFPAVGTSFDYILETPWGAALPFRLLLSDLPESVAPSARESKPIALSLPAGITGVLGRPDAQDRYSCTWKKGEVWSLALEARRLGSPLDVTLAILGHDGKELARSDDLPSTTDAGLDFTAPADGTYQVVVGDVAGKGGSPASLYRLAIRQKPADFHLSLPAERLSVHLGDKASLVVKVERQGGFKGPIALALRGLPAGVTAPPNLLIPADKAELAITLQAAKDSSPAAGLVSIEGTAAGPGGPLTRTAQALATVNLAPRSPEENRLSALLLTSTLKARFKGRPVDQDTGRKVHRGSTFPAEVIVERLDGFAGKITLQMAATQSYQVQGITGGEAVVPPGVERVLYPCYFPEWLETTRTSRVGMIAVARVPDPKGKLRYMVGEIAGFVTVTVEGALLKIAAEDPEVTLPAGKPFEVRLKVARLTKLTGPVRLELRLPEELAGQLKAEPLVLSEKEEQAVLKVAPAAGLRGLHTFTIRATAMQDGKYPVVSEASVSAEFVPGK